MSNTSKTVVFALVGVAAGVTLGVLFAPGRGKQNREKLSSTLLNLSDTLIDSASDKIDVLLGLTDQLVSQFKAKNDIYAQQYDDIEHAII